ncbi:MAG: HD domain-containing protein [Burkholderiales bacterium]|nr:HD domain-containing protein [Burkholderiales bacterium]MDE1927319.1 HD domain-containing protein [Burkholderiales bacterium]MDE2160491.1 HD domain-containing protein [Burkholderiales bacterium]MDE2503025.1 HD domain-containing protein [Burkholderiales bacterium]
MSLPAPSTQFSTANPHALATILEASETRSIIASRDIFDIAGIKLWARDRPVSGALQRKLLDRQLRNPLESCLMAEDGVTPKTLVDATERLLAEDGPLAALLRPQGARLVHEAARLPLHAVAQLLLTAGQASRPGSFDHAIQAMAVAGALMIAHGGSVADQRLAMLAGLLHDLGEMYIDPRHGEADADRTLDFKSYQQLVVHPHVGQLLLSQLTDYPKALARAVAEHHERLDGSGYPHALEREAVSPLGRLLAVTEAALGTLRAPGTRLAHASVALRVVPGEFDLGWVGAIAEAARAQPPLRAQADAVEVGQRQARLEAALQSTQRSVDALTTSAEAPALKAAFALADHLLARLRTGCVASGLWGRAGLSAQDAPEVEAIEHELNFRLRTIVRATMLRAGELPLDDAQRLALFCISLKSAAS